MVVNVIRPMSVCSQELAHILTYSEIRTDFSAFFQYFAQNSVQFSIFYVSLHTKLHHSLKMSAQLPSLALLYLSLEDFQQKPNK